MTAVAGLGAALVLAGCDPLPLTEFHNAGARTITIPAQRKAAMFSDAPGDRLLKPGRSVKLFARSAPLSLQLANCQYVYVLPEGGLSLSLGALNRIEIGEDERLYLRRAYRPDTKVVQVERSSQPPGWPVQPASRTCSPI